MGGEAGLKNIVQGEGIINGEVTKGEVDRIASMEKENRFFLLIPP